MLQNDGGLAFPLKSVTFQSLDFCLICYLASGRGYSKSRMDICDTCPQGQSNLGLVGLACPPVLCVLRRSTGQLLLP